ncbi:hypothetical protein AA0115_g12870 [Alternaria tenuissima]|uniref:Integral membrane protein n=1 Tax=Alternaria tenuissima TaxID=119927 RepID=A0AB37VX44_9PLEO|nr:hypothetical protein AA0115_g12870 [Alternaria tenuissima]
MHALCGVPPMVLTVASLICFLIVALAQVSPSGHNTSLQRDLYFFKVHSTCRRLMFNVHMNADSKRQADTSSTLLSPQSLLDSLPDSVFGIEIPDALQSAAESGPLKDFYVVGLFGYCEGETDKETGRETITHCSAWKMPFYFDPADVWQLENTSLQAVLGERFTKGMQKYRAAGQAMHWTFVITLGLTLLEITFGTLAICNRWCSLFMALTSIFQPIFAVAAAAAATVIYAALAGVFESFLRPYNIDASLGMDLFAVLWVAVACSIVSSSLWFLSACF